MKHRHSKECEYCYSINFHNDEDILTKFECWNCGEIQPLYPIELSLSGFDEKIENLIFTETYAERYN